MPEEKSEIEIGRWYFRYLAEEQGRKARRTNPGRTVEVREVTEPYNRSGRPTYVVVLVVEGKGERGEGESQLS